MRPGFGAHYTVEMLRNRFSNPITGPGFISNACCAGGFFRLVVSSVSWSTWLFIAILFNMDYFRVQRSPGSDSLLLLLHHEKIDFLARSFAVCIYVIKPIFSRCGSYAFTVLRTFIIWDQSVAISDGMQHVQIQCGGGDGG